MVVFPPSRLHQEGRIAIVTDVGSGMRWTRRCFSAPGAPTKAFCSDGQAVWSRHPDAGVKLAGDLAGDGG